MRCLCCNKKINEENETGWHHSCIKKFFGTNEMPDVEIDDEIMKKIAEEETSKGFTIPGVQKKLSLHLSSEKNIHKLTMVNYPMGYILKPQTNIYEFLPEAEQLVMSMADKTGIKTVPHALVKCGKEYAYITKRIDRIIEKDFVKMIAMEDFCQLDWRLTQDKYKGSYERCGKIIKKYSYIPKLDMAEFFLRVVFSFVIGNSDMHLKNFSLIESLIESNDGCNVYRLAPAYDMLPVNTVLPEDEEQMALAIGEKKTNIGEKEFYSLAESCEISRESAEKMIAHVTSLKETYLEMCNDSWISDKMKDSLSGIITERCEKLS